MKYVLLFCGTNEDATRFAAMTPDQSRQAYAKIGQWWQEHQSKIVGGEQLQPANTATHFWGTPMRSSPMARLIEAKEQIGGFAIVDVADLDEALRMARTSPAGSVEVVR